MPILPTLFWAAVLLGTEGGKAQNMSLIFPIPAIVLGLALLLLLVWVLLSDCANASPHPQASIASKETVRETGAQIQQIERVAQRAIDELSDQYLDELYRQHVCSELVRQATKRR